MKKFLLTLSFVAIAAAGGFYASYSPETNGQEALTTYEKIDKDTIKRKEKKDVDTIYTRDFLDKQIAIHEKRLAEFRKTLAELDK